MQEAIHLPCEGALGILLGKATFCWLISRGLAYPDESLHSQVHSGEFARGVYEALQAIGAGPQILALAQGLQKASESLPTAPVGMAEEYTYLFERGARCPPYGSSYTVQQGLGLGREMADVASLYALFGLQIGETQKELPDHASVEWEFLSFLYAKEAYALQQGWGERAQICQEVRHCFLQEHLGRWFSAFAQRVQKYGRHPFYPALVCLGNAFLESEIGAASAPAQRG